MKKRYGKMLLSMFLVASLIIGSLATVSASSTDIVINWNDEQQEIDGFGFSSGEWSPEPCKLPLDKRNEVMDLLFSKDDGIGVSIFRNEIFPGYNPVPGKYDFATPFPSQIWMMQAAQARGVEKQIASTWTPPAWMKTNGRQTNGGYLKPEYYDDFAQLLAEFIKSMKNLYGIDMYAVSMCNEPNSMTFLNWNSCSWNGEQIRNFLANYLKPTFINNGIESTKVIAAEPSWWSEDLMTDALNDPTACSRLDIVAGHNYKIPVINTHKPITPFQTALSKGKKIWMTENCDPGYYDESIGEGLRWAKDIHKFIVDAQASAYLYWQGIMRAGSEGLICNNADSTDYTITKRYYTFGHFSKFIRPGYVRLGTVGNAGSDTYLSSYKDSQTGKFVMVAINDSNNASEINIVPNGFTAGRLTPYLTNGKQNMVKCSDINVSNGKFTTVLHPKSVVTFVGENGSQPITQDTVIVDELNDWTKTFSHTSGWWFDSSNTRYFNGDVSRASRNSGNAESIIYNYENIKDFSATVYEYRYFNNISFYASPDNQTWTQVGYSPTERVSTGGSWTRNVYRPDYIPQGTKYLKITHGDNSKWEKQISKVRITYVEP